MGRSSVGGKGSGRRSGERTWGDEESGTREVTIRKVVKEKEGNPKIRALDRALGDVDDMDVTEYVKTCFDTGADAMWVCRVLANGEEMKVGTVRADATIGDDVETFLLSTFGGPGTFVLKPALKSPYGGFLRVSKNKRARLGVANEADAGLGAGVSQDADTLITRALAREDKMHALTKIQELNARAAGAAKEGGEEMKTEELLTVVRELKGSDKTSEILLEMLRNERQERAAILAAQTAKNPLEMLGPVIAPVLAFLDKKVSPSTVTKWLEVLRNPVPSAEPAETGIVSTVVGLLKDYAPMIQPYIAQAIQGMVAPSGPQPATRHLAAVPTPAVAAAPPAQPAPTEDEMATREYEDEDTKEVLDYVIQCLDAHKYGEAWAALRGCEDTVDAIAPIMPGAEPMAFYFRVRDLDERLRTRKDTVLEFIAHIQTQIQAYMAAQTEAAKAAGETVPEPAASPAPPAA